MSTYVYGNFKKLNRVEVSILLVGAALLGACEMPGLRDVMQSTTFTQRGLNRFDLNFHHDDTTARMDQLVVNGTRVDRSFVPSITHRQESTQQVNLFQGNFNETFYEINYTNTSDLRLDLLLIIDNSASMSNEQDLIANNFSNLIDQVDLADWRIAVATTSYADFGHLRGMVTKGQYATNAQAMAALQPMILAGTSGNGNERPIAQTIRILQDNPNGFIRPNSLFRVLTVTDEDECSNGYSNIAAAQNPPRVGAVPTSCTLDWDGPQAAIDVADAVIGSPERIGFYGIFWIPGTAQGLPGTAHQANVHQDLVTMTGGSSHSIWSNDYASVLGQIGSQAVAPILEFRLQHAPNAGTANVYVNNVLIPPNQYQIIDDHIHFNVGYTPPASAEIRITYTAGSLPLMAWTLSADPVPGSIVVTVNGAAYTAFTVSGRVLTFNTQIPESAILRMDFDILPAAQASFDLSVNPPAQGGIQVYENGQLVAANRVSLSGTTVHVTPALSAIATVLVSYVPIDNLPTSMPLTGNPYFGFGSQVTIQLDGQALSSSFYNGAANQIVLDPAELRVGATVTAHYIERNQFTSSYTVTADVLPGSLSVTMNGQTMASGIDYNLVGRVVNFTGMLPPTADLEISFYENGTLDSDFILEEGMGIDIVVAVSINGVDLNQADWAFDSTTRILSLASAPAPGASIRVLYLPSHDEQIASN